jgi:hypothetical protein
VLRTRDAEWESVSDLSKSEEKIIKWLIITTDDNSVSITLQENCCSIYLCGDSTPKARVIFENVHSYLSSKRNVRVNLLIGNIMSFIIALVGCSVVMIWI